MSYGLAVLECPGAEVLQLTRPMTRWLRLIAAGLHPHRRVLRIVVPACSLLAAAAAEEPPAVSLPKMNVAANVPITKVAEFHLPEPRFSPAAVTDGKYIYVIGGMAAPGSTLDSVIRLDPLSGISEPFARLKQGRIWHQAVLHGGKIYVFGGSRVGLAQDPVANLELMRAPREQQTWARLNEADDLDLGSMELEETVEIIDLATRQVSLGPPMPDPRNQFGCVALGDDIYVIGGMRERAQGRAFTNTVWIYSTTKKAWRLGVPMPTPRATAGVVVDGPFVVIPGGYNGTKMLDTVEAFDPLDPKWIVLPPLCRPVSAASVAFLGHFMFLFGNYSVPDELIAYDLVNKGSETFTLRYTAARHTACAVVADRVYVIGGKDRKIGQALDLVQVFALPKPAVR